MSCPSPSSAPPPTTVFGEKWRLSRPPTTRAPASNKMSKSYTLQYPWDCVEQKDEITFNPNHSHASAHSDPGGFHKRVPASQTDTTGLCTAVLLIIVQEHLLSFYHTLTAFFIFGLPRDGASSWALLHFRCLGVDNVDSSHIYPYRFMQVLAANHIRHLGLLLSTSRSSPLIADMEDMENSALQLQAMLRIVFRGRTSTASCFLPLPRLAKQGYQHRTTVPSLALSTAYRNEFHHLS